MENYKLDGNKKYGMWYTYNQEDGDQDSVNIEKVTNIRLNGQAIIFCFDYKNEVIFGYKNEVIAREEYEAILEHLEQI